MISLTSGTSRVNMVTSKLRSDIVASMLSMSVAASVTGKWHAQNAWDDSGN